MRRITKRTLVTSAMSQQSASVHPAGFGNVLLATEVTKLTRRQQWTVFRVQRPNLSTVSDVPLV